jgi:hypothetical protein
MELDVYGGIRPTFDKLALDFGYWFYGYPGGQCFNDLAVGGATCTAASGLQTPLPNGNVVKQDVSFWEVYGKATYTVNDNLSFGGSVFLGLTAGTVWAATISGGGAFGESILAPNCLKQQERLGRLFP